MTDEEHLVQQPADVSARAAALNLAGHAHQWLADAADPLEDAARAAAWAGIAQTYALIAIADAIAEATDETWDD